MVRSGYSFIDSGSFIMEGLVDLFNFVSVFLIFIFLFVFWLAGMVAYYFVYGTKKYNDEICYAHVNGRNYTGSLFIEVIWLLLPLIMLGFMLVPSLMFLYSNEYSSYLSVPIIVHIIGSQWQWAYKYLFFLVDHTGSWEYFDSILVDDSELEFGSHRLLEVSQPLVLPTNCYVRLLITSDDVIHCWAVPALGVKLDATPGRLVSTVINLRREGVFYGQCSELCGVGHGYMPISVVGVNLK